MFAFFFRSDMAAQVGPPPLRLHNTLSGELEVFTPLHGNTVKMYNCGPTVYGTQHIGNMRAAVFGDVLRRILTTWEYDVKQVINITDFGHLTSDADEGEDKMTMGLKRDGMELSLANMRVLAERYTEEYFADIDAVGVDRTKIEFPRASDYIPEQISLIQTLVEKGYAYTTDHGVYYDVSRFPTYGKLGNINLSGLREGARVQENSYKHGPFDFILWKSDKKVGWESPWGLGFPGWHIECTAMIFKLLGKQIDIHTGGIEHIPVHHNNEIAQAEAATGKQFVQKWLHYDHITIEGKKISKSLGNTVYVHNIADRGFSPLALRYWFLTAHYRSSANFTWDAIEAADTAYNRLGRMYLEYKTSAKGEALLDPAFEKPFLNTISNDLDTPRAIALTWDYMKRADISAAHKVGALTLLNDTFGLGLSAERMTAKLQVIEEKDLPEEIQQLLKDREAAREAKDFMRADELRDAIRDKGFEVKDSPEGSRITAAV